MTTTAAQERLRILLMEVALLADMTEEAVPAVYVRMNLRRVGSKAQAVLNEMFPDYREQELQAREARGQ